MTSITAVVTNLHVCIASYIMEVQLYTCNTTSRHMVMPKKDAWHTSVLFTRTIKLPISTFVSLQLLSRFPPNLHILWPPYTLSYTKFEEN